MVASKPSVVEIFLRRFEVCKHFVRCRSLTTLNSDLHFMIQFICFLLLPSKAPSFGHRNGLSLYSEPASSERCLIWRCVKSSGFNQSLTGLLAVEPGATSRDHRCKRPSERLIGKSITVRPALIKSTLCRLNRRQQAIDQAVTKPNFACLCASCEST